MKIDVNGKSKEVESTQLDDILFELDYENATIATAINGEFVSVETRAQCQLKAGDKLEIVSPMQGG